MSDIEAKALALLNEVAKQRGVILNAYFDREITTHEALCRAIEQHEAFKQEVSDVMTYIKALYPTLPRNFNRFIIPKPKPDPLVEALKNMDAVMERLEAFRAALEAFEIDIRKKSNADPEV